MAELGAGGRAVSRPYELNWDKRQAEAVYHVPTQKRVCAFAGTEECEQRYVVDETADSLSAVPTEIVRLWYAFL